MPKSATVHARIEPDLKEEAEAILKRLGINATQAITLFYQQVKLHRGLPFEVKIPNRATFHTFVDTEAGRNLVYSEDTDEMFKKLGI